ncbi:beta-ketoacyl synthase N-terminal-like domain-containing protein (plasmid) [Thioclava litoralis]|uniref:Beta-ketoacyl synthase N-terminal-like domain-containing protein n=1 Tax=Thioclava litoralis TaxID=3076557 RepID=A0ABZ1E2T4_9RHOB|nr:beta-ketoacyl synthase N-terminal-like domain-containing protein [Thioclava sp. FTW29]
MTQPPRTLAGTSPATPYPQTRLACKLAIVAARHAVAGPVQPYPPNRLAACDPRIAAELSGLRVALLPPPPCPAASFRIPPIYERAVSMLTLNLLWLAREAVSAQPLSDHADRTDILVTICGGFDATLRNALKVAGVRALAQSPPKPLAQGRKRLQEAFGSTTHDKVGEMASIIAARIGIETKARGRILALENAEAGLVNALQMASLNLSDGSSDRVIIGTGQRIEGAHMAAALQHRFGPDLVLEEGASLLVLRRLDLAQKDGDPILGVIETADLGAVDPVQPPAPTGRYGLGHEVARQLRDALETLPQTGQAVLAGRSLYGQRWQLRLSRDAQHGTENGAQTNASPPPRAAPLAILGSGACYGPFTTRAQVGQAFRDGENGIGPVSAEALPRSCAFDPQKQAPLTSYSDQGAESPVTAAPDATRALAYRVAKEALSQAGATPDWGRWSIILATQLCTNLERQVSNAVHQSALEAILGSDIAPPPTPTPAPLPQTPLCEMLPSHLVRQLSVEFGLAASGLTVESACASSLAALDLARAQLRAGQADAVLVIAAETPINQRDFTLCSAQRMLSAGRIAPFCQTADGFSPGDGAGAVVLRRLADCATETSEASTIEGVILGIGGSSDALSFTAPDASGQMRAMQRALEDAAIAPETVSYVEAHGTGTRRGDGIEIEALNAVYAAQRHGAASLGSVKSLIGHSFAAAGMAGLFRALEAVQTGQTPPTLLRGALSTELGLEAGGWQIRPTADTSSPADRMPAPHRRAAVNALGTGGTNFHMIIEAAPAALDETDHICI